MFRTPPPCPAPRLPVRLAAGLAALLAVPSLTAGPENPLERDLGRNETRVLSAAFPLAAGQSVARIGLAERLERLGYERVRRRPERAGQFFWGHEVFWIWQRPHRHGGRDYAAQLFGLALERESGTIRAAVHPDGSRHALERAGQLWIEPEVLTESLDGRRARRIPIELDDLPEHAWRAVLAAEDARFFDHVGVDGISLARAMLANVRAGRVTQGGSTITQQLIKNRALSPKRSLGRKASEALRALALEAEHDKRDILESYLDHVYLGHVDGLAIHGIGAAARAWFSRGPGELTLAESAALAAMIQGPNRLTPTRHAEALRERRDWVLGRMQELGWAGGEELARAKRSEVTARPGAPEPPPARRFLGWLDEIVAAETGRRARRGRGVVAETTLDGQLQRAAERALAGHLATLRRRVPRAARGTLSASLVALDARDGAVLAYVAGDPSEPSDEFDRVRAARRQPGSVIKPLVLLEALEDCGAREALHVATRIADEPLTIDLPGGPWIPENFDRRFRGIVSLREALRDSLNVPIVRVARWCGFGRVGARLARAGLAVPDDPPPSTSLGALEASPLEIAAAYTVFSARGRKLAPRPFSRIDRPGGRKLTASKVRSRRVARASSAWIVRDLLIDAVRAGTGRAAAIEGVEVAGKTGTSSGLRDAWFAGQAGSVVAVAWAGRDDGGRLGLTGAAGAAPLWRAFMESAVASRPALDVDRPFGVLIRRVDPRTGRLESRVSSSGREEPFRRGALPPRKRLLARDRPTPAIR